MTESLQRGNALSPGKRQGCVPFIPVAADGPGGGGGWSGKWPQSVKGGDSPRVRVLPERRAGRHVPPQASVKQLRRKEASWKVSQLHKHKQPGSEAPEQATGARSPCRAQGRQRRKPPPVLEGFSPALLLVEARAVWGKRRYCGGRSPSSAGNPAPPAPPSIRAILPAAAASSFRLSTAAAPTGRTSAFRSDYSPARNKPN